MSQPLFDIDLWRVTREHYITGKAAVNFPFPGVTTGGWHYLSYWDRAAGVARVSLAGVHYPDTTAFFGDAGVCEVTQVLERLGWAPAGRAVYMADHYRAAADMVVRWALSESPRCNVEIDEWFPGDEDKRRFVELLGAGRPRLQEIGRLEKVDTWLRTQPGLRGAD
ncbi:hypothetical protein NP572_19645 [Pseudomonas putida]|uniref:hypothetical protein n=1 Tax=Pseudomonas putida TaxID=303 RepID=UPI0023639AD4|nr:hypothetical protein [Pseudomonas putida]MDD2038722.1 hypothetical protein [Pseudomonas putida]MDD2044333.1 hypothetical protein [Pseudomonas putida]